MFHYLFTFLSVFSNFLWTHSCSFVYLKHVPEETFLLIFFFQLFKFKIKCQGWVSQKHCSKGWLLNGTVWGSQMVQQQMAHLIIKRSEVQILTMQQPFVGSLESRIGCALHIGGLLSITATPPYDKLPKSSLKRCVCWPVPPHPPVPFLPQFLSFVVFLSGTRVSLRTAPVGSWTQLAFRKSTSSFSPLETPQSLPHLSLTSLMRTR